MQKETLESHKDRIHLRPTPTGLILDLGDFATKTGPKQCPTAWDSPDPTFLTKNPRIGAPKSGAKEKESVEKMMAREAVGPTNESKWEMKGNLHEPLA